MGKNKNIDLLPDETLASKLIKKGFWLYFFTILIAPTGYIIRVIVSNSLSVSDVGILYGVISLVSLISVYNDLGLTESLSYFIPKYWIKKKYGIVKTIILSSLSVQLFTGILLGLLLFFGADWLAIHYFHDSKAIFILKYFVVYFLFINLFQVIQSILRAFQNMFLLKLIDFIKMGTTTIFTLIFFFGGFANLSYYALAWILGLILTVFVGIGIVGTKYKQVFIPKTVWDSKIMKSYMKYALAVFVGANAGVLLGQVDMQMIIYFLGGESAGYYSNYLSLIGISGIVVGPLLGLLFPLVTELVNKKSMDKYKLLLNFFYKYFSVFAISLGALLFVLGPQIASILFGVKFLESGNLLHYSALFLLFNVFVGINFSILAGLGKVKERVKILLIATIINLILNFVLINLIGLPGAIISTVFGWILMVTLSFKILNKYQKITFDWKFIIKNIIYVVIFMIGLYYLKNGIFVLDNSFRMQNLLYLLTTSVVFYLYLASVNYKSIIYLKREILELKNNK